MKYVVYGTDQTFSSAYSGAGDWIDIASIGADSISCVAVVDVDTPAAKVVASAAISHPLNRFTSAAHGFTAGLKVQVATSNTLPDGLVALTDYFVIVVDADTFKLASSLVNALAETAIDLIDAGVGNQTVTPVALAGANIKFQQANDTSYPVDLGSATNITVDGNLGLEKDRPTMQYVRVYITLTAGHISASLNFLAKGDRD